MKCLSLAFLLCTLNACSQTSSQKVPQQADIRVGGPCEGCEAIYECPVPFEQLSPVDTLPDFHDQGEKILLTGKVYESDGVTPAKDVVIYAYHTDQRGLYPKKGDEKGWARRHGFIRGWIRTDADGNYSFYTLRPASYPNSNNPQHVHVVIKEPGKTEYWIVDFLFSDDPLVTKEMREAKNERGGPGIVTLQMENGMMTATRNIYLGRHIPGYPEKKS